MGKISKKISKGKERQQEDAGVERVSINRRIEHEAEDVVPVSKEETDGTADSEGISGNAQHVTSIEETTAWLIDFLGREVFIHIKENPNFSLPFTEEDIAIEAWLTKALKTVCTYQDIHQITRNIQDKYFGIRDKLDEISGRAEKLEAGNKKLKADSEELEREVEILREKKNKSEKKLEKSVSAEALVQIVFGSDEELKTLLKISNEALESPSEAMEGFLLGLIRGWLAVKDGLFRLTEDEEANVTIMQDILRDLLEGISGFYIPQRRSFLDTIALIINRRFESFEFISPEQTLQVDPTIHNAKGLGSSKIVEGVSFAVIRKHNRQTYLYADVKV
ncbi:MAG: hypothetical protein KJ607_08760 [Bacteroidetes bacterium]|nr:hypothetical protein [Bacteroidota bacterium]